MKKSDRLHIYIVPSPQNAQGYAELKIIIKAYLQSQFDY